jgi:hypothetical protein
LEIFDDYGSQPINPGDPAAPARVQAPPQRPPKVWEGRPPETPQEVALDKLMEHVGPIAEMFFDAQVKMRESQAKEHERELAFETKLLEHDTRRHQVAVVAGAVVAVVVLVLAGLLMWNGRDASALDIIKTLLGFVGVGFGGWGIAMSRRRREKKTDDD